VLAVAIAAFAVVDDVTRDRASTPPTASTPITPSPAQPVEVPTLTTTPAPPADPQPEFVPDPEAAAFTLDTTDTGWAVSWSAPGSPDVEIGGPP